MKVVFLGSGNVATHLALAMQQKDINIIQVFSNTIENAEQLANKLDKCYAIDNISDINNNADVYIISVKDDAVKAVVDKMKVSSDKIVVHTAGSVGIDAVEVKYPNSGVFYPLQSFSKNRELDYSTLPFLIEASNDNTQEVLMNLASLISKNVAKCSSEERLKYHISAVFSSNFVNYMYYIADDFLAKNNLSFDVIRPLILETALKVQELKPKDSQTGPARRKDFTVVEKHIQNIQDQEIKELYSLISNKISNTF